MVPMTAHLLLHDGLPVHRVQQTDAIAGGFPELVRPAEMGERLLQPTLPRQHRPNPREGPGDACAFANVLPKRQRSGSEIVRAQEIALILVVERQIVQAVCDALAVVH